MKAFFCGKEVAKLLTEKPRNICRVSLVLDSGMTRKGTESLDWGVIGENVRQSRCIQGKSQANLAQSAGLGISTIYQVERGMPIGARSFRKIADALDTSPDRLKIPPQTLLAPTLRALVHRPGDNFWTMTHDQRSRNPEDNLSLIQDAKERLRLGRLGLVSAFCAATSFIMPEGPGLVNLEVFGKVPLFNATIYRFAMLSCTKGRLRLVFSDETVEIGEGEIAGYRTEDLQWMEPASPVDPVDLPVLVTWIGSVRVGKLV